MRNLILLSVTLIALFIANSAQANEVKDMSSYLKLANLSRDTSVTLNQLVSFNTPKVSIEEKEMENLESWAYEAKEVE